MRRTRYVALPVRAWQYVGLLVVSLACLTLGLVSRDKEGRAGSLAGPELKHRAPHEVDACPNLSPFTKMPSCSSFEQNHARISKTTEQTRNSGISLLPTGGLAMSRSRSLDRASSIRYRTRADFTSTMQRLGRQRSNVEYDSRRTARSRMRDRTRRVSDSAIRPQIARSETTPDPVERRLVERSSDYDRRRSVNRRVTDSRERSMERLTSTADDSRRRATNERSPRNAVRRNRIETTIRRDSSPDRDHRSFIRMEQREPTDERPRSLVTSLRRSADDSDRERNNRLNLARERRESSPVRPSEIASNYLKERRVSGSSNDRRSERRSVSADSENHVEGRIDRRLVERTDNRAVRQRVDRRLSEERVHRRLADRTAERRLVERRTDRLVAEKRSASVESRYREEARTTDQRHGERRSASVESRNREEARTDRQRSERRTNRRLMEQTADRVVAKRRAITVESRFREETTDQRHGERRFASVESQNRVVARADRQRSERRTNRYLMERRADRLVVEKRSTPAESRFREEVGTTDQRYRKSGKSVSIESESREEARADRRLVGRRTDARLIEQRADRRRLVVEISVESRARGETRTDRRLVKRRADGRELVERGLAGQRMDRRDSNSRRSVRQTVDTDRSQGTGAMLTRVENDIRSSQKGQRFINDVGRSRSVERDIRSADRDSRSRSQSIQDTIVLRRRDRSRQRISRIPVGTRSLTAREKSQARDNDFMPRMKILNATDFLKQRNSMNYAFTFEIIRQAFAIGLCTMYGLSIFYGKRSFVRNFARQGPPQFAIC